MIKYTTDSDLPGVIRAIIKTRDTETQEISDQTNDGRYQY